MDALSLLRIEAETRLKPVVRQHSALIGSVVGVRTAAPVVVMTYDDGPDPAGTEPVLAALTDHRATATFFMLLTRARKHASLVREIVAAGHEVALHGLDHRKLSELSFTEAKRRTLAGKAELEDIAGVPVHWMRPPYGSQRVDTWLAIRNSGLQPVMWSRTTWDSRSVEQSERVRKATSAAARGDILLAHDGFAGLDDGVDDGPEPLVDRGELARLVLAEFERACLSGRSLGDALVSGELHRALWFCRRKR